MPRYARTQSKSNVYHIMLRGINRTDIFLDEDDKNRFIDTIIRFKEKSKYEIYAYCLMDNHIHLLIKELEEPINVTMKRIGVSYAYYFNRKYKRIGHLFQDRYLSETIEDDAYILAAVRYIHNNPVKAKMVKSINDYKWSSYREYLSEAKLIKKDEILGMFAKDEERAVDLFKQYSKEEVEDAILDIDVGEERDIVDEIIKKYGIEKDKVKEMSKSKRNEILREIKTKSKVSVRDLSRILGIGKDIIFRA